MYCDTPLKKMLYVDTLAETIKMYWETQVEKIKYLDTQVENMINWESGI